MERLIRMFSPLPDPPLVGQVGTFSGLYAAEVGGTDCAVRLWFDGSGFVHGSFSAEGETLELRGGFAGRTGTVHGIILEPLAHIPVAMFSARVGPQGLSLRLGMPDFDELFDHSEPAQLLLSRIETAERVGA